MFKRQEYVKIGPYYEIIPEWTNGGGHFKVCFYDDGVFYYLRHFPKDEEPKAFLSVQAAKDAIEHHRHDRKLKADFFNDHKIIKIDGRI